MAWRNTATTTSRNSTRGYPRLLESVNNDFPPGALRRRVATVLASKDPIRTAMALEPQVVEELVEILDQAYPNVDTPQGCECALFLFTLCNGIGRFPKSAVISSGLDRRGNIAVAAGGFTDVWRGHLNGNEVAIKAFRIYPAQNLQEAKGILWKRTLHWRRLSHQNILPFRGVDMTLFQLSLVYDWGPYGNISQYLSTHPHASRTSLLLDVAEGLKYLHESGLSHGNLKGTNVIIDQAGRACLTEYGLAPIISGPSFTADATPDGVANSRWLAPEIMNPFRRGTNTPVVESKAADVFAFGMFAVEVFTGKIPFEERKNEEVVIHILAGARPEIPENARDMGLTGGMRKLLKDCWHQNPKRRPTMKEVASRWRGFIEDNTIAEEAPPTAQRRAWSNPFKEDLNIFRLPRRTAANQPERKLGIFRLAKTDEAVDFLGSKSRVTRQSQRLGASQRDCMSSNFPTPQPSATHREPRRGRVLLCGLW